MVQMLICRSALGMIMGLLCLFNTLVSGLFLLFQGQYIFLVYDILKISSVCISVKIGNLATGQRTVMIASPRSVCIRYGSKVHHNLRHLVVYLCAWRAIFILYYQVHYLQSDNHKSRGT
jgi:hypothetical protein